MTYFDLSSIQEAGALPVIQGTTPAVVGAVAKLKKGTLEALAGDEGTALMSKQLKQLQTLEPQVAKEAVEESGRHKRAWKATAGLVALYGFAALSMYLVGKKYTPTKVFFGNLITAVVVVGIGHIALRSIKNTWQKPKEVKEIEGKKKRSYKVVKYTKYALYPFVIPFIPVFGYYLQARQGAASIERKLTRTLNREVQGLLDLENKIPGIQAQLTAKRRALPSNAAAEELSEQAAFAHAQADLEKLGPFIAALRQQASRG